ncbi:MULTISPECIES: hypothetical protein [Bacillus amyloliquefaciens group]|uniref:hypothetical protein n=1 Tax=Bacillus TaxID=1386 RepID=UPI0003961135|nr:MULTISPECIES: hypothetical protein [Bacillus amyloliquefaciens group]ERH59357.1 hypothetical protein O205_01975 [Bacillus amyloliquefaciens EGD-AQ14]MCE4938353.1 hypothetical protein [Bacillus velezensis]MDH3086732.1 hypothetical protein [Bacillus velezensis]POI16734.1 hypothetical protein C2145_11695 [Bacillus velezensis]QZY43226.1 hypothetical protein K4A81_08945 [Bacillus velezensis]
MDDISFWQPFITSVGTLLSAGLGGFLAHFFFNRRESSASKRNTYEKLYSPILYKIFSFYEYNSLFRRDISAEQIYKHWLEDIYFHTRNNLKYATPKILSICESIESVKFIEDGKGSLKEERLLELVEELLNSVLKLKIIDDNESKRVLERYRAFYFIWRILATCYGPSTEIMDRLRLTFVLENMEIKPKRYKKAYRFYSETPHNIGWDEVMGSTLKKIGIKKEDRDTILNSVKEDNSCC